MNDRDLCVCQHRRHRHANGTGECEGCDCMMFNDQESGVTNIDRFREIYTRELTVDVERDAASSLRQYSFGVDKVTEVAAKMVDALAKGNAHVSDAVKRTCRELGIKTTNKAIKEYFNS